MTERDELVRRELVDEPRRGVASEEVCRAGVAWDAAREAAREATTVLDRAADRAGR